MQDLAFPLSVAGLVLGLISAWPRLATWAASARNVYSKRAQRIAQHRMLRFSLAASDASYFVALAARNACIGFGLLMITVVLSTATTQHETLQAVVAAVRIILSLVAGSFLGNLIGIAMVVMHRKEEAARGSA